MKRLYYVKSFIRLGLCMREMSAFVQSLNPFTGQHSWEIENEDYDYHQEIARSMYADMLHDSDRNKKYFKALKHVIDKRHSLGLKAHVLDIGTGTGLLSMMAAKCNADSIVACEAFPPIADVARKVIADNGLSDKIRVIGKRSTELEVGPGKDLEHRANILVTEVFDTELIGEGAIETFNHAKTYLLEPNADVIPNKSRMYAAVVESDFLTYCNKFREEYPLEGGSIIIPDEILKCPGTNGVHDLQLSELSHEDFKLLTPPIQVFTFDFGGEMILPYNNESLLEVTAQHSGSAQVVLMWWELDMDTEGTIVTCAPNWVTMLESPENDNRNCLEEQETVLTQSVSSDNSTSHKPHRITQNDFDDLVKDLDLNKSQAELLGSTLDQWNLFDADVHIDDSSPWRDHWMQAVYHLPQSFDVDKGQKFALLSSHDEFSLWFNIYPEMSQGEEQKGKVNASVCRCGAHVVTSRTRISEMNSLSRWKGITSIVPPHGSVVLFISDFSLVPLALAKQGAEKVYCVEDNPTACAVWNKIIKYNNLEDKVVVLPEYSGELLGGKVEYVLSEPYFRKSIYPWDNLRSVFTWEMVAPEANLFFPQNVRIVAVAMSFKDLHKIKTPLGSVEGFDLRSFDNLIEGSSEKSDSAVETQPLWEYPGMALSGPAVLYELQPKIGLLDKRHQSEGSFNIKRSGVCHGVALWVDYLGDNQVISGSGPVEYIVPGKNVRWNRTARQGVFLFRHPVPVEEGQAMEFSFELKPTSGTIGFKFKPKAFT